MESRKLDALKEEMKQKQIQIVKNAVKETFEKLEELEKQKGSIQEAIKLLKHDLFDLKDGRLDRIMERHNISSDAGAVSILAISKEENAPGTPPWYESYSLCVKAASGRVICSVNNSVTRTHASGSYKLSGGLCKYL